MPGGSLFLPASVTNTVEQYYGGGVARGGGGGRQGQAGRLTT